MILPPERCRDLRHPAVQVEAVSVPDVVPHDDVAVRPALSQARSEVPAALVERPRLDRPPEIVVAERTLVQPGPGRWLAAIEPLDAIFSVCDHDRLTCIG